MEQNQIVDRKDYSIGGRKLYQTVPVAAQATQLLDIIKGIEHDWDNVDVQSIVSAFLSNNVLSKVIAVILREEGKKVREKNISELAEFIDENMTIPKMAEVLSDFFTINNISVLLKRWKESENETSLEKRIRDLIFGTTQGTTGSE